MLSEPALIHVTLLGDDILGVNIVALVPCSINDGNDVVGGLYPLIDVPGLWLLRLCLLNWCRSPLGKFIIYISDPCSGIVMT